MIFKVCSKVPKRFGAASTHNAFPERKISTSEVVHLDEASKSAAAGRLEGFHSAAKLRWQRRLLQPEQL